MPKGIYDRKKAKRRRQAKAKRASASKKASRKTKAASAGRKVRRAKRAANTVKKARLPKVYAEFGAVIETLHEFGRLIDARSKLLIDAVHDISDAIREAGEEQEEPKKPEILGQNETEAQASETPAEETAGANVTQ